MKIISIVLAILFIGCASTTEINTTDPDKIIVTGASDELITYEGKGVKVTSDRRGKPNVFQSLLGLSLKKAVDTEVGE